MKAILIVVGVVVLAVIGWVGYMKSQAGAMEKESLAYVNAQVPAITAHWDFDTLKAQASPEFMQAHTKDQLAGWLANNSKLGPVKSTGTTSGAIVKFRSTLMGGPWTALYSTEVKFENGDENISMAVQKLDGAWKIAGMSIAPVNNPAAAAEPSAAPHF